MPSNPPKDGLPPKDGKAPEFPPKNTDDGSKPPPTHARRDDAPVKPNDPVKLPALPPTSLPPPLPSNLPPPKDGKAPEFPPKNADEGSKPPPAHARRDDAPVKPVEPVKVPAQPPTTLPPPLPSTLPPKDAKAPKFPPKKADDGSKPPPTHARRDDAPAKPKDDAKAPPPPTNLPKKFAKDDFKAHKFAPKKAAA